MHVPTLKEDVDVADKALAAEVRDNMEPWRLRLDSEPYPDSACGKGEKATRGQGIDSTITNWEKKQSDQWGKAEEESLDTWSDVFPKSAAYTKKTESEDGTVLAVSRTEQCWAGQEQDLHLHSQTLEKQWEWQICTNRAAPVLPCENNASTVLKEDILS